MVDVLNYEEVDVFIKKSEFKQYFEYKFYEFFITSVLMKTIFSFRLMFILKELKVIKKFNPSQKIGFTKKLINKIFFSLIKSCDFNDNSFDEIVFCNELKENIIDLTTADYLYLLVKDLLIDLKTKDVFFSLQKNKFSIKSNIFYLSFINIVFFSNLNFYYKDESFLEKIELDFFIYNKNLNDYLVSINDENKFKMSYLIINKLNNKIEFETYRLYYYDYYNIDFFNFNDVFQENILTLKTFNNIIRDKFDLNTLLFYITVSSFFKNYIFDQKYNIFLK